VSRRKRKSGDTQPMDADEGAAANEEDMLEGATDSPPPEGTDTAEALEADEETLEFEEEVVLEGLTAELERVRAEGQEYLDGWQRSRAEFANYRKRVERENQESHKRAAGDVLCRYLGVIDDLELALRERPQEGDAAVWAEGIEIIHQKLLGLLQAEGVEPIQAQGEIFDPNFHEALSHEESSDHEEGQVIEVIRQGYVLGERVLRPALVRVAK
jgi:molecular chaperone GrpE